jgi:flagellar hook assembly protein FlgD
VPLWPAPPGIHDPRPCGRAGRGINHLTLTWPVRVVFVLVVGATFAAFFAAQRIKGAPPVVRVTGMDRYFSPNGDGRRDANRFTLRMEDGSEVAVDIVDAAGEAVRRLTDGVRVRDEATLQWDGRTDDGGRAPDGEYHVRATLRDEGRSVTVPRVMHVDTEPPRPRVKRIEPSEIVAPDQPTEIQVGSVSARRATRLRIYRTDGGAPRAVAELTIPRGERRAEWDGTVDGKPAPQGTYLVQVTTRDRAGNRGSTPTEVPPPPGEARGKPGLTVRAIAAAPPLRPVTAGERVTINVDARRRAYRWRLRRAGRSRYVETGREGDGDPVQLTAPRGDSGLYLLELRTGQHSTTVPVLVQSRDRADMLVVVPAITWVGTDEVDQDADGVPNTLEAGTPVNWPRVFAHGLPPDLTENVAPLLVYLDRQHIRYDLTTDLDLALSRNPRASDRKGVLLAGSERWITRPYARRLRRYVADGGRLASFGAGSLRRGVTILHDEQEQSGQLVRPTQPTLVDPFGTRFSPLRRVPADATLTPIGGDPNHELLTGFDGALSGFSELEESEPPRGGGTARLVVALGVETAPETEESGVPEELPPPAQPAFAATRIGSGLMVRIGLPQWAQRLDDPQVAQLTHNVADVLRGVRPRIR